MLVPAINDKYEVECALKLRSYSNDYYYYTGVTGLGNIELVEDDHECFQWVSKFIKNK